MRALRFLISLSILSSLWATLLLAQDERGDDVPAAEGSTHNVAVGYSFVNSNLTGQPSVNLSGVNTSGMIDFLPHWGAILDASYVRAGRDPGSGHSSYVLSVLTGPVFYPVQSPDNRFSIRALAGVSVVDGSVRVNQLYYRGWLSRFSWAVGAGIERNLPPIKDRFPFAVRFNVDYLRTKFLSSSATVQPQNGLRFSASFVYRFGPRETTARSTNHP